MFGLMTSLIGSLTNVLYAPLFKIKTEVPEKVIVADGSTSYKMNIRADSTEFPDTIFRDVIFGIAQPPEGITYTTISLPSTDNPSTNLEDFFYNINMDPSYNWINNTGGERLTENPLEGAINRSYSNGFIGEYVFTVPLSASPGQYQFDFTTARAYDTQGLPYKPSSLNFIMEKDTFTIVRPIYDVRKTDGLEQVIDGMDGKVDGLDAEAFEACSTGPGMGYNMGSLPAGCVANTRKINGADYLWADSDGDNDVDQGDFGAFQRCLGENKYAPSECLADE